MADYKILVGTELDTKGLNKQVKDYKGDINVGVNPESVKSGIDIALKGYTAAPIEVGSTLNTQGITDAITKYSGKENRKKVKVGIDPDHLFDGVETIISNKTFKTPLKVNVDLNWTGVAGQIANPDFGAAGAPKFKLDVELDDDAFLQALEKYKNNPKAKEVPFRVKPTMSPDAMNDIEATLETYEAKTPLKVKLKLNKNEINKDVADYNKKLAEDSGKKIIFNATLRANAIDDAITNYKTKHPDKLNIPIDFKINSDLDSNAEFDAALKRRIESYEGTPLEVPVRLKPAKSGFKDKISKVSVDVDATLANADALNNAINNYSDKPLPVTVKLIPATTGFTSELTKTPIQIQAELAPDAINNAISNPAKPFNKIPIGVTLKTKDANDINKQVQQLQPFVTEELNVGVTLDKKSVNEAIATFEPIVKLEVKPDLALKDVDEQIRNYVPSTPVKVNVLLDNNDTDEKAGKPFSQEPIQVNAKLNQEEINKQINGFKTDAKIKVGVKLDFSGHKDKNTKEYIQKGIAQQIKEYQGKTKLKVGVQLDKNSINEEISQVNVDTPIRLGVEFSKESIQNIQEQIDNVREQLEALGNIRIELNRNIGGRTDDGNGSANNTSHGVENVKNGLKQITATSDNTADAILNMKEKLLSMNIDKSSIDKVAADMEGMGVTIKEVTAELKGTKLNIAVSGIDSANEAFRVVRQLNTETKEITQLGARIKQSFSTTDEFVRDVNKEMDNFIRMQNEINQKKINIQTVKTQGGDLEYIETLERQLKDLEATYSELMNTFMKKLTINADIIPNDDINRFENAITALNQGADFKIGKIVDKSDANIIKEINNDMTNLKNLKKEIGNTKIEIQLLKTNGGDVEYISLLETRLNSLEKTYVGSKNTLKDKLTINADKVAMDDVKDFLNDIAILDKKADIKVGQIVDKSNANTIKEINKEMDKFVKLQDKITSVKTEIGKLEVIGGKTNQVAELNKQLEELEVTYGRLMGKFMDKMSDNADILPMDDVIRFENEIAEATQRAENELDEFKAKIRDAKEEVAKGINLKLINSNSGLSQFDNEINAVTAKYNSLSNKDIPALQTAMNELSSAFDRVKNASKNDNVDELIQANKEYEAALKAVKAQLDINARTEKEAAAAQKLADDRTAFQSKIDAWLTKNSAAAKRFGAQLLELKEQAENCDRTTLDHLEREFRQVDKDVEAAGLKMQTLGDRIKTQFQKYSSYLSVASLMMYTGQALRDMFEQVKLIDSAMTELKKVTNETDASYNKFLENAASRAKELGTTIDGLVSSTADFARLGYGFKESQKLAEVANIYAVVGDEIEGVEDATQSLVSTMAAFKGEMNGMNDGDFAMGIVDKMNEVSNNFAISSGGIGQALQRSASSMAAANNSLDETIAMITAANEVAQNPEKVGRWLCRLKKWLYRLNS